MKNKKVSIIITCYNYERYVASAIESALNQTYDNIEIIVIDDGSTDRSYQRIAPYLTNDKVRLIRQRNAGQANAKNNGIRASNGSFIAFLDADDLWLPSKLEKQINLFNKLRVGVVYSRANYIDANGKALNFSLTGRYLQPRSGYVTPWLIYDNFVPFSSSVVRRECFEKVGLFNESLKMGIDWDLWLRLSTQYLFKFVDEALIQYRIGHSGQMSKNLLERIRCADIIIQKFIHQFPNSVDQGVFRDAAYYSCCLRGYILRQYGLFFSLKYYCQAISLYPWRSTAYKSLLKSLLSVLFRR